MSDLPDCPRCDNKRIVPSFMGYKPCPCTFAENVCEPDAVVCQHEWTGQQLGGPPDMAESTEWVCYCKKCGMEKTDDA